MDGWREAFLAMSELLGEPTDRPRDEDKTRRALSLARALGEIALDIENLQIEMSS